MSAKNKIKILAFAFALALAVRAEGLYCAKITGYVADGSQGAIAGTPPPAGLSLQGITVSLTGSSSQTYVTSNNGYYEFTVADPGKYTVTPSSTGRIFQPGNQSFEVVYSTVDFQAQHFSGMEYIFVLKWGANGTAYGNFNLPAGVAVSSLSCVIVADMGNHRVQRFSSSGTVTGHEFNEWGETVSGNPVSSDTFRGFNQPFDVAVDSAGWIYAADTYNNRVKKFDPETDPASLDESTSIFYSTMPGASTTTFNRPNGISSDNRNNLFYVADTLNNRITQFSSTGVFIDEWSGSPGGGQFNGPKDVATMVDENDDINIYVADTGNNRIQRFIDPNGALDSPGDIVFDWQWGTGPGSGNGQFNAPSSVALGLDGSVYVADTSNDRIQKFSSTGVYVTKWGYNGTGDGKFVKPYGVAVDSNNCVYVSDRDNYRIQKFEPASSFVSIRGYAVLQSTNGAALGGTRFVLSGLDPVYSGIASSTLCVTGADGYFEFLNLPVKGSYTVTPSSSGYIFTPVSFSSSSLVEPVQDYRFVAVSSVVVQKYFIQGYITQRDSDPSNQPVEAAVYLTGTVTSSTTASAAEGLYLFENLPAGGSYTVTPSFTDLGFDPASRSVSSLSADINTWNFSGFQVTSIKGYVLDASGTAIPDVRLDVSESATATVYTNSTGYYEFLGLPKNGHFTVRPSKLDYSFDPAQLYFNGDQLPTDSANFTASYSTPTLTDLVIAGYVRTSAGTGVNSVTVSMYDSVLASTSEVVTDSSGFFKFTGLTGRKNYKLTPDKLNWLFTPASTTTYLNTSSKEEDSALIFTAEFLYNEAPPNIDIPLGANGTAVQVSLPPSGAAKVVVEERPSKPAKYRGTVNPENNEAVGIMFRPSVASSSFVNRKFTIRIFTLKGELADEFTKTPQAADDVWIKWIPKNLASGIYIVHVEGPGVKSTKKIAILK